MNVPVEYNGEELFLLEGSVSEVHVAATTVNILEQIQKRSRKKNLAVGRTAALTEMHGIVATSAALPLYEGEDVHNFACILKNSVMCGTFKDADKLRNKDVILAVVSKRGDIYFVHSLRRISDDLFMLPLNAVRGPDALFRSCMRVAWNITRVVWIILGVTIYSYISIAYPGRGQYWIFILFTLLAPPLVMFPMELMTYRAMESAGDYAEAIFKVFGIPRPASFDATKEQSIFDAQGGTFLAPNFAKSLTEHKRKFKIRD